MVRLFLEARFPQKPVSCGDEGSMAVASGGPWGEMARHLGDEPAAATLGTFPAASQFWRS